MFWSIGCSCWSTWLEHCWPPSLKYNSYLHSLVPRSPPPRWSSSLPSMHASMCKRRPKLRAPPSKAPICFLEDPQTDRAPVQQRGAPPWRRRPWWRCRWRCLRPPLRRSHPSPRLRLLRHPLGQHPPGRQRERQRPRLRRRASGTTRATTSPALAPGPTASRRTSTASFHRGAAGGTPFTLAKGARRVAAVAPRLAAHVVCVVRVGRVARQLFMMALAHFTALALARGAVLVATDAPRLARLVVHVRWRGWRARAAKRAAATFAVATVASVRAPVLADGLAGIVGVVRATVAARVRRLAAKQQ